MIDTIVSVKPRRGQTPGFIKFSAAGEKSTFLDEVLDNAEGLIGQRVEYTLEERAGKGGKTYQNVASLRGVAGGAAGLSPAERSSLNEDVELPSIATAIDRLAFQVSRIAVYLSSPMRTVSPSLEPLPLPPGEPVRPVDSAGAAQQQAQDRLGKKVGNDAAKAMISALRLRYAEDVNSLGVAVDALLAAHGA